MFSSNAKFKRLEEAAAFLGCSERTVRRMVTRGELPAYRLGARRLGFLESDLNAVAVPVPTVGRAS